MYQPKISEVDKKSCALTDNEYRIGKTNGIYREDQATARAEVPEADRHDTASGLLAAGPLQHEARRKQRLTRKPDCEPLCITEHQRTVVEFALNVCAEPHRDQIVAGMIIVSHAISRPQAISRQ